ncbi:MAG: Mur ligase family protein [Sodaliphilus pleomorphus]|jgi:UDP-N-acetylmuramate--alanine ligase|uniref:UDP-N-acetylmuramate--L-alanine ligase n=1 Tax=Sodaliphilus pleomorphus TaxID=2606626 RepID=UPI0023F567D4|nr:Mur ligase family protein [Sodaliphilus pleomorphus]MCI5981400.1 UDP-N-acetylmuramate--L-alanine ligase [Muribaculaceae bacterium]MCI6170432.1 UDP-N-acetylmuramate--L-alanine ligase [Muribaculaceae bacterium]MDD6474861.1 Mur ligase family protein [Sodaliphilus pleomorphus]MDD7066288.1 Mur ligase family protein [Sodaliphilus pleomorphus]
MSKDFKSIYFVGAGGIGMAALERYFLDNGKQVAGYDRTATDLTRALEKEGVEISYVEDPDTIPAYCRDKRDTVVVYTAAIHESEPILKWFLDNGFEVMLRAKALGIVTRNSKALCFSGTHGKTTTSSMAAHILQVSGVGSNAFLGGVLRNYGTNFLLSKTSPYSVVEADEFNRSFHELTPYIAVVSATDPDHLDIYGNYENYLESFAHFTELIEPGGVLLLHTGLKLKPRPRPGVKTYTYSIDEGDFHAARVRKGDGEIVFDFVAPDGSVIADVKLGVPVEINIDNAVAAMAVCWLIKVPAQAIKEGIATFMGAKRRFEFWLKEPGSHGHVVIDDYAHHPNEIKASIKSVRDLYPGRKLTVIFQPHLYTRTRDFAPEFARALSLADECYMLPIYPAREEPIAGVSSELIMKDVTCPVKKVYSKENLLSSIHLLNFDILLTVGAGDIVDLLPRICEEVKKQQR